MTASAELELARHFVDEYVDEWQHCLVDHSTAMECRDCEEWLEKGIVTFRRVRRAEEVLAEADRLGIRPMSVLEQQALDILYRAWLGPCDETERWIADLRRCGYSPANLAEFRDTCEQVHGIIEEREWYLLSKAAFESANAE